MHGDSMNYLYSIKRAIDAQDGKLVADLICLRDSHVFNKSLQNSISDSQIERQLYSPFDEIVSNHLSVIYYLSSSE